MSKATAKFQMIITPEDGPEKRVIAGQREMAEWERQPFGCSSIDAGTTKPILFWRFLAYSALRRTWQIGKNDNGKLLTFDEWDRTIIDVDIEDDEKEDPDDEGDDPTRTDQSTAI